MQKGFKRVLGWKAAIILIVSLGLKSSVLGQDTIKVMHYNLLYYGKQVYDCTSTTNNIDDKNGYLKTIIQHVKPDIFSVNELDGDGSYPVSDDATYLLDHALNVDGVNYFKRTDFPDIYLANTVFYNSNKLRLKKHIPISFVYGGLEKIFNVYKFYYNADNLETTNDTAYIYCLVAHLKAGNSSESQTQRNYETSLIMDYFESLNQQGNFLILGDFNVYSPNETCFQNMINPDNSIYTFYDPANQIGEWSSNYDYRYYHTQSTHGSGDCYSGGGMDDRFDFILASDYIINGADHFKYIPESYQTIGQDGSRFNNSLNITTNTEVPSTVAQALFKMSDHLPVYLEMEVDQNRGEPLAIQNYQKEEVKIIHQNPVSRKLEVELTGKVDGEVKFGIFSVQGEKVFEKSVQSHAKYIKENLDIGEVSQGLYILNISCNNELIYSAKLLIQN